MRPESEASNRLNRLKAVLQAGTPVFGAGITMPSVPLIQLFSRAGFDWLMIDMEHGPIDMAAAHAMIAATDGTPAVPLLRIAWNLHWLAKPALDAGALGIVFPMVASREEAEAAVRAVRYPPAGERGWGPFYTSLRWDLPVPEYAKVANDEILTVVLIETREAVERVEEITAVPGIDVAAIAPFDLASSLGHPAEADHPEVQAAVAKAESAILKTKVTLGGLALSSEQANRMLDRGYRYLALGYDALLIQRGMKTAFDGIKR